MKAAEDGDVTTLTTLIQDNKIRVDTRSNDPPWVS